MVLKWSWPSGMKKSRHSRRMLPINRSQKGISLGSLYGRFQYADTEAFQGFVGGRRKDLVSVVDQVPTGVIKGQKLAELLDGPFGRRVLGDVVVQNPRCGHLHDDQDVQHTEGRGDHHAIVTRDDSLRVVPHKGGPAWAMALTTRAVRIRILRHCARRYLGAKLQPEFIRDSLLAPGWILAGHLAH